MKERPRSLCGLRAALHCRVLHSSLVNTPTNRTADTGHQHSSAATLDSLLEDAGLALRQHDPEQAHATLLQALKLAPDHTDAWRMLGFTHHLCGRHTESVACLRRALALDPDNAMTHMGLGIALHDRGDLDEAVSAFERACGLAPDSAACWFNLGKALKQRDDTTDRACDALERALRLDPNHTAARLTLAGVQTSLGRLDAAIGNYHQVLQRQPAHPRAWWALANAKTTPFSATDTHAIAAAMHDARTGSEEHIMLGFTLARALEDRGDYRAAFSALATANTAKRRHVDWSAAAESKHAHAIAQAFAQPAAPAADAARGHEIVFVVSLPRSGSTLVEQILASHRQVQGGGEILDLQQVLDAESAHRRAAFPQWAITASADDWARLGKAYLTRTAHWRAHKPRSTDKNLFNWKLTGAALAMLPGARFINVRRDPLETCLACYRQLFRTGNGFSYALEDLAAYWHDYDRLCRQWARQYPQRFLDLRYESLVAQPQIELKRLLDFCGLDHDSACLDFQRTERAVHTASAAQIRQPLRRDTARAERYGAALDTLRALLAADDAKASH